jgi:hypothetical protein
MLAASLLAVLVAVAPAPPALAELSATLARLSGRESLRARIEHRLTVRSADDPAPRPEGQVDGVLSDGVEGVDLRWSRAVLAQAAGEAARKSADPDAFTPTRDALTDLDALSAAELLDAAPSLARSLERAALLEDRDDVLDGRPARLLVVRLDPALGKRERKFVKEVDATLRLWLGPDGAPAAAEVRVQLKGRAFLVIGFESEQRESLRFARAGGRLVVLRRERTSRSEGGGERGDRRAITTVSIL